jgi:hypothetical protein
MVFALLPIAYALVFVRLGSSCRVLGSRAVA